MKLLFLQK